MDRILVIGDIHGELSFLEKLLEKAAYNPVLDQLILIGDYIDRGPDSCGVLEKVMALCEDGAVALRGNHEEMLLRSLHHGEDAQAHWMRNGAVETIASYQDTEVSDDNLTAGTNKTEHLVVNWDNHQKSSEIPDTAIFKKHVAFIRQLDYLFETTNHLFVHAGVDPDIPLFETDGHTLVWIRDDFFSNYQGEKTVVFGHTPTPYLHDDDTCHDVYFGENYIIGIDGGAVFGGQLNCLELPSNHVYSVSAPQKL